MKKTWNKSKECWMTRLYMRLTTIYPVYTAKCKRWQTFKQAQVDEFATTVQEKQYMSKQWGVLPSLVAK